MADFIDRALATSHPFANGRYDHKNANEHFILGHESYREWLEGLPSADVRPVKHGRWVKVGGFFTPGGDPVWQCSECGKGRHVYGIEHGTYGADVSDGQWLACPNCMAIMEGESDG